MAAGTAKRSPSNVKGQKTLLSFFRKSPSRDVDSQTATPPKAAPTAAPRKAVTHEAKSSMPQPEAITEIASDPPAQASVASLTAEPTLSTPEPSSQPIPSSPTRVGRRNKRKLMIVDSDSEEDENPGSESEDDWVPTAKTEDHDEDDETFVADGALDSELSELGSGPKRRDPNSFPSKRSPPQESAQDPPSFDTLASSDMSPPPSRRALGDLDPSAAGAASLAKFSISSDYTPEKRRSSSQLPRMPEKIRVSEDPERYKWLLHIKDADGHSPDDPDYDPRTIHVPNSAWAKFTPFEKQYWEVKQNLWNTVVFFKKGKFYELYENDAEIAHRLFDLKLAGGGRANMSLCGVPEMSFDYWASAFIAKGYKIARVDQAETALGKEMRDIANKKKEEKIIRRELSCVLTGGTLTDATMLVSDLSQYCMSIKQDGLEFAACFVDTATSHFYISHFTDKSSDYPMLESLLAQVRPKELVLPRGNLEKYALKIVKNNTSVDTLWELVKPDLEFWDADTARREVDLEAYFGGEADKAPEVLVKSLESSDLAASAIGGLVWYLRTLKLDKQLLSLGQFGEYDATTSSHGSTLVLDGQTLQNLEVFANSWDGGSEGTLFKLLNRCITPFGKRRLRSWIAHPLQRPEDIARRADAVDMFMLQSEVASVLSEKLVGLPDAERMLSRVHAGSLKPKDFVRLVGGLESMARILSWLDGLRSKLPQLEPFVGSATSSDITALEATIEPWMTSFDHMQAKTHDILVPEPGVDEDFDATREHVVEAEKELHEILKGYRKDFKTTNIEYRDSGKEIYLIEVPVKYVKQVPHDWQQMGATSKFKRYWSPEVKALVRTLQEAQERHKLSAQATQQKLYAKFCSRENYTIFVEAVRILSAIDCLVSLARTSEGMAIHCRPEIVAADAANKPVISFTNLRHPVAQTTDFIPNDVHLGAQEPRFSLLTGANAAGKSTVLRTTCCAILLAQLGCHVPAEAAELTPVDRIMTRLGASDNIFAGKSTFHMELAETERILSEATSRSFVVLDELGRGGSSSDGFAIAEAVLHHLATHVQCMGFFATHYATLYDSFALHPQVKPERMAISVDQSSREVTFLYKLESGRSEGSFGMNVASMCGVAPEIVAAAEEAAQVHEHTSMLKEKRQQLMKKEVPLGLLSDVFWHVHHGGQYNADVLHSMLSMARDSSSPQ